MKIELENFGPISHFKFDLSKDLSVIFGKNNIGKSYAITAVYLILKHMISGVVPNEMLDYSYFRYYHLVGALPQFGGTEKDIEKMLTEAVARLRDQDDEETDITVAASEIFQSAIGDPIIQSLEKSFNNSFASIENLSNKYSNEPLKIKLEYKDFELSIGIKGKNLYVSSFILNHQIVVKKAKNNRKPLINDKKITFYVKSSGFNKEARQNSVGSFIRDIFLTFFFDFKKEISDIIDNVYFLPASRSGLYQALSTFSAVIAELSKSRNFLTNSIELPNISEPVSDYFLNISNITPTKSDGEISKIAKGIEEEILGGEIQFNEDSKKIFFSPKELDAELDLSVTSSMISEIAPIVAFLKYIIKDKKTNSNNIHNLRIGKKPENAYSLIFIEEPEAHLHPEIQVKLMEFFTIIIKHKVKIIMTTHSNYMFNKLSNLLLADEVQHDLVGSYLMKWTANGSVIDELSMRAESEGMEDYNFADVAESLYNERLSLYNKVG